MDIAHIRHRGKDGLKSRPYDQTHPDNETQFTLLETTDYFLAVFISRWGE